MRAQFLEKLIKKYPNHYQLGAAVSHYYNLRQKSYDKEYCEEKTLKTYNFGIYCISLHKHKIVFI